MMGVSDLEFAKMEQDVMNSIKDWHSYINLLVPKPLSEQPNYNTRLREFNGEIIYDRYDNIPAERIDGFYVKQSTAVHGDKNDGSVGMYIPIRYQIITGDMVDINIKDDSIVELDGDEWRIKSWRKMIGEYFITIKRKTGEDELTDINYRG